MKKLFQQLTYLTALALLFGLSGCITENQIIDNPTPNGEGARTVSLQLVDATAETRGTSSPGITNQTTPIAFHSGNLYLITTGGTIARHYTISATELTVLDGDNMVSGSIINRNCLIAGVLLRAVPGNVNRAAVVANFCNDVVGDIAGTLSGAIGAGIVISLTNIFSFQDTILAGSVMTSLIAGITVGGKAIGKNIALNNANAIVFRVALILTGFEKYTGWGLLSKRR